MGKGEGLRVKGHGFIVCDLRLLRPGIQGSRFVDLGLQGTWLGALFLEFRVWGIGYRVHLPRVPSQHVHARHCALGIRVLGRRDVEI
jgi:hypothetical protein